MTTTNNPAYTDEQGGFGNYTYSRYRGVLSYSKSSTSGNAKTTVSWTAKVQMKNAWGYGVGIKVTGADTGSGTGYLSSSPGSSYVTVKTITGSFSVTGDTSSQTKNLKFTAYGTTVSGYGSAGGSVSETVKITIPALKKYTITFKPNGGTGGPSSQTKYHGKNIIITSSVPTRTGYTFQGWARSTSGDVVYKAGTTCTMNSDQTLYAIWKINTYTVSYNANGGSGGPSSQTKTYGHALTITSSKPTRTDYNFTKWNTTSSGSGVSYSSGGTIPANTDSAGNSTNKSFTLYAQWEKATCVITFNANGGTGSGKVVSHIIGTGMIIPNASATAGNAGTKAGYEFIGWSKSATATTATYTVGMNAVFNSDTVLYAVWSPIYLTYPYGRLYSNDASSYNYSNTIRIQSDTGSGAFYSQFENFKFVGWYLTNKNQALRDVIAKNWLLPYSAAVPANIRTNLKNINNSNAPTSSAVIMAMYRDTSPSTFYSVSNDSVRPADRSEASFNSYINSVLNNKAFTNIGDDKAIFGYIEYNSSTANLTYDNATLQAVGGSSISLIKDSNFFLESRGNILFFRIVDNSIQESTKYKFTLKLKDTLQKPVNTEIIISYKQQIIDIYKSPADGRFKIETPGDIIASGISAASISASSLALSGNLSVVGTSSLKGNTYVGNSSTASSLNVYGNIETRKVDNAGGKVISANRIVLPYNTYFAAKDSGGNEQGMLFFYDNKEIFGNNSFATEIRGSSTSIANDVTIAGNLTLKGHEGPIGEYKPANSTTNKSLSAGTVWAAEKLELTPGMWVMTGQATFSDDATAAGYRRINISSTSGSSTNAVASFAGEYVAAGHLTGLTTVAIISVDTTTTYYLNIWSGVAVTCSSHALRAIRIR